ncbi:MAG TPA: hypothetical protein VL485_05760 [Ktedonobacteraceae bacterium]|nr:hypothetical protein [Ktedonobacteraceae bacterium]
MNNEKDETVHAYATFHFWRWRLFCLFFPLIGMSWMVFGLITFLPALHTSFGYSLGTTIPGLICLILMIYLYRAIGRTRYVITEDGMTYYTLGFRLYTPWKNLLGVEPFRPYPSTLLYARTFPSFKLRERYRTDLTLEEGRQQQVAVLETSWWQPVLGMAPYADRFPVFEATVGYHWQERAFGRDVRQYAPWVF